MFNCLTRLLIRLNYNRLKRRKQKRFRSMAEKCSSQVNLCSNECQVVEKQIKSLLIVDTLHCFGDSLYVNALIRRIRQDSPYLNITVLSEKVLFPIYEKRECCLFDYKSTEDVDAVKKHNFDLILDLDYKDDGAWNFRQDFYGKMHSVVVTLSQEVCRAKIFTGFIALDDVTHFGQRMEVAAQFVREAVKGKWSVGGNKRIQFDMDGTRYLKPWFDMDWERVDYCNNAIYINTQGQKKDRSFSDTQVQALIKQLERQKKFVGWFYVGNAKYSIRESEYVKLVHTETFSDAVIFAAGCRGIVTPDTSMVHVASAINKPLLAIYALGKLEYPSDRDHAEVWRPLGNNVLIYSEQAKTLSKVSVSGIVKYFCRLLDMCERNVVQ